MISKRAEQAIAHLTSRGLPLHTATGIVAGLIGESGGHLDTNAVGDKGKAYGIGQWHPDRQANFARAMGRNIRGSSLTDQLDFVLWEMRNTEGKAGKRVMAADNPASAAAAFTRHYERPKDIPGESAKRARIASQLSGVVGSSPATSHPTATKTAAQAPSFAEFYASRKGAAIRQPAEPSQQQNAPSFAEFYAARKGAKPSATAQQQPASQPQGDNGQLSRRSLPNMTPTLTAADAPKQDALVSLGAGLLRGVEDVGAGLNRVNQLISNINPMSRAANAVTGGMPDKMGEAINEANKRSIADYMDEYKDNGTASFGRFAGNAIPFMIPGTQLPAVTGAVPNIARGAATGAINSAIIGGGRNPDGSLASEAALGAVTGGIGSAIGNIAPRMVKSVTGGIKATAGNESGKFSGSAIERLIKAGAPDLPLDVAATRLQGAIRQGNTTLVPGASPTTAQAAMTKGVSQAQRDVLNYGQGQLADKLQMQEQARIAQLLGVHDVTGVNYKQQMQDSGVQIGNQIRGAHDAAKQATRDLYQSPALQQSVVDTSELGGKLGDIYAKNFTVGGEAFGGHQVLQKAAQVLSGKSALPYQELQNVRSQVAALANDFGADANIRRVAGDMRAEIDNAIDALPGAAAAKAARTEQGKLYESGIVGDITGRKKSGDYALTEDAIMQRLLSPAAGQTARAQGFNAVADASSKEAAKAALMADMMQSAGRSIGTDAQSLAAGTLDKYVAARTPMMRELLTPDDMAAIQAVSQDATRAANAASFGKAIGSNTEQNRHGALNLGLMDSPVANFVASKIPLGSVTLDPIRKYQRDKLATELGGLLSNPDMADAAITAYLKAVRTSARGGKLGGLLSVPASQGLLDR